MIVLFSVKSCAIGLYGRFMMTENSERLRLETKKKYVLGTFRNGLDRILHSRDTSRSYTLICAILTGTVLLIMLGGRAEGIYAVLQPITNLIWAIGWLALCSGVIFLYGYIPHSWQYYDDFTRAGIYNAAREAPLLVSDVQQDNVHLLTFRLTGFPLNRWEENRTVIDAALNITVLSITQGCDNQLVVLQAVLGRNALADNIPWDESFLEPCITKIALGVNAAGVPVYLDFAKLPHWLLAAATGMGKTQLLHLVLHQLRCKNYDIYLADYKGIDFGAEYRVAGHYADNNASLRKMLDTVVDEMYRRRACFANAQCSSFEDYVQATGDNLPHIVVVLDETSMILDITGREKDEKADVARILRDLLVLGRTARAFKIFLLLSTQRTDVASIPGSLKAHTDGRICGHTADAQSSIVILDDGSASKLPAVPGRFIVRNGCGTDEIIQAFYYRTT